MADPMREALEERINARLQRNAVSRDRAQAAGRMSTAACRQSDIETLEWVLSEMRALAASPREPSAPDVRERIAEMERAFREADAEASPLDVACGMQNVARDALDLLAALLPTGGAPPKETT